MSPAFGSVALPLWERIDNQGATPALSICPLVVSVHHSNQSFRHWVYLHISLLLYKIDQIQSISFEQNSIKDSYLIKLVCLVKTKWTFNTLNIEKCEIIFYKITRGRCMKFGHGKGGGWCPSAQSAPSPIWDPSRDV
uniref:Uncharacterized protein n=1 Tax=Myotis myotis TaxID=51298 RepID=A0A7J7VI02_MYOMY|nr:hypothetical protein mMyoMyo1_008252 [Myotis myotis]